MLTIQKSPSTEDILQGCRQNKSKAQEALYIRLAPKMLGLCFRYIQDRTEAEHVMIGGFVKVFKKITQYKGEGSLEGWVKKIMVNESLMYIRKNQMLSVNVEIEEVQDVIDYDHLDQLLQAEDILKLIEDLPIGYRTIFNLYAIEGYSHEEIAQKLDISQGTSKSQLSRARKMLQGKLIPLQQSKTKKKFSHGK